MFARLLLLFIILPTVELWLLFQVGDAIGLWSTLAIILLTGIVGSTLAKREGVATWRRLQQKLRGGGLPGTELLDGAIILVAGALLVTPGVLTDFVGFLGLIPPSRAVIREQVSRRFKQSQAKGTASFQTFSFGASPTVTTSEHPDDADAAWQGQGRQVPSYAEERVEPRTSSE